jgi:hypothetical protein
MANSEVSVADAYRYFIPIESNMRFRNVLQLKLYRCIIKFELNDDAIILKQQVGTPYRGDHLVQIAVLIAASRTELARRYT